jgi:hypothetical protein
MDTGRLYRLRYKAIHRAIHIRVRFLGRGRFSWLFNRGEPKGEM